MTQREPLIMRFEITTFLRLEGKNRASLSIDIDASSAPVIGDTIPLDEYLSRAIVAERWFDVATARVSIETEEVDVEDEADLADLIEYMKSVGWRDKAEEEERLTLSATEGMK